MLLILFALLLSSLFALLLPVRFALLLPVRFALPSASASFYGSRSLRERGRRYLPLASPLLPTSLHHRCYLPVCIAAATYQFALPLLPTACVATATCRLHYCCYLPLALPLLPAACIAAATCRLHCRCYLPFALPLLPAVYSRGRVR